MTIGELALLLGPRFPEKWQPFLGYYGCFVRDFGRAAFFAEGVTSP